MTKTLLQWFGVLALCGLVAASVTSLFVVRDRIHVTIVDAEGTQRAGPEPVEILRADLADARSELSDLRSQFSEQLSKLHAAVVDELDEHAAALRGEFAALDGRVQQLGQLAAARAEPTEESRPVSTTSTESPAMAVREPAPPAVVSATGDGEAAGEANSAAADPVVSETAPKASKRRFLAFDLPSSSFAFDGRQRLAIVPSLSRVGFDAKSTLHDFSGVTQAIEGELLVDLAHPEREVSGELRVEARSIDTGVEGRDEEMRSRLDVKAFPTLRFEWQALATPTVDAAVRKVDGTAVGVLTVHGVAREVHMPVHVSVDASHRVAIVGEAKLKMSDYGIDPPKKLGVIGVEDELRVWIALTARSMGRIEAMAHGR